MASPQAQRLVQLTQELRNFFNTVKASAPQAAAEFALLDKTLDNIALSRFTTSGANLSNALRTITQSASATTSQLMSMKVAMNEVISTYNKIPHRNQFSLPTDQRLQVLGGMGDIESAGVTIPDAFKNVLRNDTTIQFQNYRKLMSNIVKDVDVTKINEVSAALNQIQTSFQGVVNVPNATSITGGVADPAQLQALQTQIQALANYRKSILETRKPLSDMLAGQNVGGANGFATMEEFFKATLPGGTRSFEAINRKLVEYGFNMDNVKRVTREASTGLLRVDLGKTTTIGSGNDAKEFSENMTLYMDKVGNILNDTQKRFRSFGSAIARDIGEVLKWSIAIAIIYTPMQKTAEAIEEMTAAQALLADVQIVTKESSEEVFQTYKRVAEIASSVSESIQGTVETYKLAYIAAGNLADQNERAITAQVLLSDSLVLAKLSGMDQSQALDVLSASLKQLGMSMTEGVTLLNSWVAVSKVANVDIETLAQSFSIVGSAAENVGADLHTLNGIIAAAAEVSNKSATETGNMVRAFVSGIQAESAEKELARYGIAIRSSSGDIRDFMDIMKQLRALIDTGMISESQAAKIFETIGGGARRGAQFSAFAANLDRVEGITKASEMGANAYEAIEVKTKTLESANTRLANSFQLLTQTMGEDGGALETATFFANVLNEITKAVTSLTAAIGPGTGLLALGGLIALYLQAKPASLTQFAQYTGRIAGRVGNQLGKTFVTSPEMRAPVAINAFQNVSGSKAAGVRTGAAFMDFVEKHPGWTLAGSTIALSAVSQLAAGNIEQAGGAIAGGILGALMTGGSPVGAAIGSSIGQAFTGYVSQERNLSMIRAAIEFPDREPPKPMAQTLVESTREELKLAEQELFRGQVGNAAKLFANLAGWVGENFQGTEAKWANDTTTPGDPSYFAMLQVVNSLAGRGDAVAKFDELYKKLQTQLEFTSGAVETPFVTQAYETNKQFKPFSDQFIKEQRDDLFRQLAFGEINASTFRESSTNLNSFGTKMAQLWTAVGEDFINASEDAKTFEEAYVEIADTILSLSPAEAQEIVNLTGEIETLANAGKDIAPVTEELTKLLLALVEYKKVSEYQLPSFAGGDTVYTADVADQIYKRALDMRDLRLDLAPDDATREHLIDEMGSIAVRIGSVMGEGAKTSFYQEFKDIDQADWDAAFKDLEIKLPVKSEMQVSAMTDVTQEQLRNQILPLAREIEAIMKAADFQTDEFGNVEQADLGLILKNYVTDRIVVNQLAFSIAQEKTNELLEKQVEGIYNLPTDGTFFVPWQAAGGATGSGDEDTEFSSAVDKFGNFVDALSMMTDLTGKSVPVRDLRSLEDFMYGPAKDNTLQTSAITGNARIIQDYKDMFQLLQGNTAGPSMNAGITKTLDRNRRNEDREFRLNLDRRRAPSLSPEYGDLATFLLRAIQQKLDSMGTFGGSGGNTGGQGQLNVSQPMTSATLNLNINSSVNVQLDGKMVARALKQYMFKDLIKVATTNPIINRSIVA